MTSGYLIKQKLYILLGAAILLVDGSCTKGDKEVTGENLSQYVDPFIGTAAHGHTYPGAAVPFGMVQVSHRRTHQRDGDQQNEVPTREAEVQVDHVLLFPRSCSARGMAQAPALQVSQAPP